MSSSDPSRTNYREGQLLGFLLGAAAPFFFIVVIGTAIAFIRGWIDQNEFTRGLDKAFSSDTFWNNIARAKPWWIPLCIGTGIGVATGVALLIRYSAKSKGQHSINLGILGGVAGFFAGTVAGTVKEFVSIGHDWPPNKGAEFWSRFVHEDLALHSDGLLSPKLVASLLFGLISGAYCAALSTAHLVAVVKKDKSWPFLPKQRQIASK